MKSWCSPLQSLNSFWWITNTLCNRLGSTPLCIECRKSKTVASTECYSVKMKMYWITTGVIPDITVQFHHWVPLQEVMCSMYSKSKSKGVEDKVELSCRWEFASHHSSPVIVHLISNPTPSLSWTSNTPSMLCQVQILYKRENFNCWHWMKKMSLNVTWRFTELPNSHIIIWQCC